MRINVYGFTDNEILLMSNETISPLKTLSFNIPLAKQLMEVLAKSVSSVKKFRVTVGVDETPMWIGIYDTAEKTWEEL